MNIPEYTGQPLSILTRATTPESDVTLWMHGYKTLPRRKSLGVVDELVRTGYQVVDQDSAEVPLMAILSQLCDFVIVAEGNDQANQELWLHERDIAHIKANPVVLCLSIDTGEGEELLQYVPMLQFLPPPRIGEFALLPRPGREAINEKVHYTIAQLPNQAHELYLKLCSTIVELAEPGQWIPFANAHRLCVSELEYMHLVTGLRAILLKGTKDERENAKRNLYLLDEAHKEVVAIRSSWLKPDWLVQWNEVRRMAKELAKAYQAHHEQVTGVDSPLPENKPLPDIASAFHQVGGEEVAEMYTPLPFQSFPKAAIAKPEEWQQVAGEKEGELILSHAISKPSGTTFTQVRREVSDPTQRDAVLAKMWEQVKRFSDLHSDIYLAMVVQLKMGKKDEQGFTWITADQLLDYRGIKRKENPGDLPTHPTGGHRMERREEVAGCVGDMQDVFIKIQELEIIDDAASGNKRRLPKTTLNRLSRLFIFGDVVTHNTLPLDGPSKSITIAWQFRESAWMLPFLDGPNRFTGILFKKILNYDPFHEVWEKRLSKHFLFWLRTNARHTLKPSVTIGTLLEEYNLEIDERNPQRTRDRFEKAMNRLQSDGLLIWRYKDELHLPARKWLPTWMAMQITVEDPPIIKSQYLRIQAAARIVEATPVRKRKRAKSEKV